MLIMMVLRMYFRIAQNVVLCLYGMCMEDVAQVKGWV